MFTLFELPAFGLPVNRGQIVSGAVLTQSFVVKLTFTDQQIKQ